jgi:hypothetical protein
MSATYPIRPMKSRKMFAPASDALSGYIRLIDKETSGFHIPFLIFDASPAAHEARVEKMAKRTVSRDYWKLMTIAGRDELRDKAEAVLRSLHKDL